jgi:hypothetical protein
MTEESNSVSPVLKADWFDSRWGKEDQRGNGNLMTREKVLEAVKLIRTGEVVSLGMPYDTRMPIAPGRAYALRMPGGPTGGPYGGKSRTIRNDEFIATEIGQIGTQMDALGHLGMWAFKRHRLNCFTTSASTTTSLPIIYCAALTDISTSKVSVRL